MRNLIAKESRLCALPVTYAFIAFGLMFMLPGYPILCGAFFCCLGMFQSFQNTREANDLVFSALLPVAKKDVARAKVLFCCAIEVVTLLVMAAAILVRMTVLADSPVYLHNALMNANPFALGAAFVLFGLFNIVFVAGFFKTSYQLGKPFLTYIVVASVVTIAAEAMHHIPGLEALNAFGFDHLPLQLGLLCAGAICYAAMTALAMRLSADRFERTDL